MHSSSKAGQLFIPHKAYWPIFLLILLALVIGLMTSVLPTKISVMTLALPFLAAHFVLAIARFDLAVLLAVFFAPLVPPSIGLELSPSLPLITMQRVMLLSLYMALFFRIAAGQAVLRILHLSRAVWFALLVYLGASVASGLFTAFPLRSLYRVLANLFDNIGLCVVIAIAAVTQRESSFARKAVSALWISFAVLALLGLIDTLTGFNLLYYLPSARGDTLAPVYRLGIRRGQGFLPHSTALSIVAAQGAILTMLIITWYKKTVTRTGLWLTALIFISALIGSMTRTGWFVFLAGGMLWLFLSRRIRLQLVLVILSVLGLLALVGIGNILYVTVVSGFDISQQNEVSTLYSRVQWASIVWENVSAEKVRFLFGFGPGSVGLLTTRWSYPGFRAQLTTEYLIRLAEGGLVGLFSFVVLLLVSIGQSRRLIRSSDLWTRNTGVFFFVAFVQMALAGITLPLFAWAQTTYVFWILLGVVATARSRRPEPSGKRAWISPSSS
jgi:O-antigen ligase